MSPTKYINFNRKIYLNTKDLVLTLLKAQGFEILAPEMLEEEAYRSLEPFQGTGPLVEQDAGKANKGSHIQASVHMDLKKLHRNPLDIL